MATTDFKELFDKAKKDLEALENTKQKIIVTLASDLAKHSMAKFRICAEICKELKGYVTDFYVRKCLPDEYKDMKKKHDTMNGEQLKDNIEKAQLIEVTTDGKQHSAITKPELNPVKKVPAADQLKKVEKKLGELEIENNKLDMLVTKKAPIILEMQKNKWDLFTKEQKYFDGSLSSIVSKILREYNNDNNPEHQYKVMIQRIK